MNNSKKDKAVVFATNDSYCFALANVIMNIEKHDPNLVDEYVIYTSNVSQDNKDALLKIVNNIVFIEFSEDYFFSRAVNVPKDAPFIEHWSHLPMAHFEIFDLLDKYKKILYLDADLFINSSIAKLFDSKSLAWRAAAADFHGFAKNYITMPEDMTMPNGGLIFVNDSLENYKSLTQECYNILNDGYGKIRPDRGHDEIILGILNYKFSLNVEKLPMIYNCPLGGKQTNKAVILHFMGPNKIWKNPILWNMFPDFKANYAEFTSNGGHPFNGDLLLANGIFDSNFGLLQSYQMVKYTLMWTDLLGDMFMELPEDVVQSPILTKSYVRYYLKSLKNPSVNYEISCDDVSNSKKISFNVYDVNIISNVDIRKRIRQICLLTGFEYKVSHSLVSCSKSVKNSDVKKSFLLFIELTKNTFISLLRHK
ncbi:glycosyltransferase [Ruminobacter sp.]|uniref:glycosyltransferase n=1 Tax=Ruminobacter sp. TaxID=2774296 RepID=UPI0038709A42